MQPGLVLNICLGDVSAFYGRRCAPAVCSGILVGPAAGLGVWLHDGTRVNEICVGWGGVSLGVADVLVMVEDEVATGAHQDVTVINRQV